MCLKDKNYNISTFLEVFKAYTDAFLSKADDSQTKENIKLKIDHSLRVFKNAQKIAMSLNLEGKSLFIAELSGLFHDIGRFEQFTRYNTFKDDDSLYHGKLGEEVLKKEKFLSSLDENIQEIVCDAVYNHGLIRIERNNEASLLYSRIVRDADKIDIFRIVAKYYNSSGPRNIALEYGLKDDNYISDTVMQKFKDKQLVDKQELRTLNDFKAMQLAWIFDLNFEFTKEYIQSKAYLDAVLDSITNYEQKEELKSRIRISFGV